MKVCPCPKLWVFDDFDILRESLVGNGGGSKHSELSATVPLGTVGVFGALGPSSILHLHLDVHLDLHLKGPPPLTHNTRMTLEGPFFRPRFQTPPKPPQCHPLGPKGCPRPPKCLQNGGQREPRRVLKNVFVSNSVKKCRPLQNLIIYYVS